MKFISLYSGSKGNASLIVADNGQALLLDCGVSFLKIKKGMEAVGVAEKDLLGIFITHEHSDHVRGLSTLLGHWDKPVYCNRRTALALPVVSQNAVISENGETVIGPFRVERYSTYHDAAGPCGYCFFRYADVLFFRNRDKACVSVQELYCAELSRPPLSRNRSICLFF